MSKLKLSLLGALLASSFNACLFDDDDNSSSSSSSATSSSSAIAKDSCGPMLFAMGNNFTAKAGKLYANSLNGSCKWEISVYSDSRVFAHGNYAYLLEGLGSDKLTRIEAKTGSVVYQSPLLANSNPHAIGFVDDSTALVGLFGAAPLYKVNLNNGKAIDSLDLGSLAASGAKSPSPEDILVKDGKAYVVLQRQDATWKSANQVILQIDPKSLKITDSVGLKTTNTFQLISQNDKIFAISKGNTSYGADYSETSSKDGGIEEVNFANHSTSVLLDEEALAGKPVRASLNSDGKAYVAIYKKWGSVPVALVDLTSKTVTPVAGITNAQGYIGINPVNGNLLSAEDDMTNTGIYELSNGTKSKTYFDGMLSPYNLVVRP